MKTELLGLQHQPLLTPLLKKQGILLSEFSFATLYLFREIHSYEVLQKENIYIRGRTRDGFRFIMPTTPDLHLPADIMKDVDFLFPIPERWVNEIDSTQFKIAYSEADSDYIYSLEKMRQYPGRHLSKKRNLVHQFHELYESESFEFSPSYQKDALKILEMWHVETEALHPQDDYQSAREAIQKQSQLGLSGRIYYVNKQPAGFILSENLTSEMVLYQMVKADRKYKGIYQYIYQDFAQHLPDTVHWLNLEQDLGIPELHQAKHSYSPDMLLKKFRVQRATEI